MLNVYKIVCYNWIYFLVMQVYALYHLNWPVLIPFCLHKAAMKIHQRGTIYNKSSQICVYADDIAIIARKKKETNRVYMKNLKKKQKRQG
jgi:hypothetical protein